MDLHVAKPAKRLKAASLFSQSRTSWCFLLFERFLGWVCPPPWLTPHLMVLNSPRCGVSFSFLCPHFFLASSRQSAAWVCNATHLGSLGCPASIATIRPSRSTRRVVVLRVVVLRGPGAKNYCNYVLSIPFFQPKLPWRALPNKLINCVGLFDANPIVQRGIGC